MGDSRIDVIGNRQPLKKGRANGEMLGKRGSGQAVAVTDNSDAY